jgi:NAD(P)-dependent dehydrogenase (short-subunit alcohol dehydrogenase family)
VTVNAVAPSAVTRMSDTVPAEVLKERAAAMGVDLPPDFTEDQLRLMLIGDPAAVANFITYLGTDGAKEVTGQIFAVIGGHVGVFAGWAESAALDKLGTWSIDELTRSVPASLARGFAPASPMG